MKLTKQQMDQLNKDVEIDFENRLFFHFEKYFPDNIRILKEYYSRELIRFGINKARQFGFVNESDICIFISLMIMLGVDLDVDPQIPWAGKILASDEFKTPTEQIDALHEKTMTYLDEIAGETNKDYRQALFRLREDPIQELAQFDPSKFEYGMILLFRKTWWKKTEYLGETNLRNLINLGMQHARKHYISDVCGTGLYIMLMFILGSGFYHDPQFPWACELLAENAGRDRQNMVDALHEAAFGYLDQWMTLWREN